MNKEIIALILLLAFGCSIAGCVIGNDSNSYRRKTSRDSFAFVQVTTKFSFCDMVKHDIDKRECEKISKGFGSGFVIKREKLYTLIVTAEHVCSGATKFGNPNIVKREVSISIKDVQFNVFKAKVVRVNKKNDICLLKITGDVKNTFKEIKFSTLKPSIGKTYYNIATPLGMFERGVIPIFAGIYIGRINDKDIYTIPTAPGSSGSPIFNKFGEVSSMTTMAAREMENFAISIPSSIIEEFLTETRVINDVEGDIKKELNWDTIK